MSDVLELPFDQYQRYRIVADLLDTVRGDSARLRLLDVGGRTGILRSFMPRDEIVLVDMEASEVEGLVLGDGARLPFKEDSFDAVAAFDTLEHVPPRHRDAFVAECARVARRWVMIAGPYASPEVDEAEELLTVFLRDKLGVEHRYLAEHRRYGLPSQKAVEEGLGAAGASTRSFGHANLERWLVLMCLELYLDQDPCLRPIAKRFFRFYNRGLYASDHAKPVYRHVVVGAFDGAPMPSIEGVLAPPVAPPDTMPSLRQMGLEVLAFDRENDVWQVEIGRLKGIIGDLERDVSEHRATEFALRELYEEERKGSAQVRVTLEADLAAHRETENVLRADLDAHREALEILRADLESHRTSIVEIRERTELIRSENRRLIEHASDLRQELARQSSTVSAMRRALERPLVRFVRWVTRARRTWD